VLDTTASSGNRRCFCKATQTPLLSRLADDVFLVRQNPTPFLMAPLLARLAFPLYHIPLEGKRMIEFDKLLRLPSQLILCVFDRFLDFLSTSVTMGKLLLGFGISLALGLRHQKTS